MNKYFPFVIPLVGLILGIYWQSTYPISTITLLVLIVLILSTLTHSIYRNLNTKFHKKPITFLPHNLSTSIEVQKNSITTLLFLLFLFSGAFLSQHKRDSNEQILQSVKNQQIKIFAKVQSIELQQNKYFNYLIKLNTHEIKTQNKKVNFTLSCYAKDKHNIKIGDLIELNNVEIKPIKNDTNKTGKPTFYDYLLKENVLATIFFNKKTEIKILNSPLFSLNHWISQKREQVYKRLKQKFSTLTFSYFAPIFLGNKNIKNIFELKSKFNNWGLTHYLARSGLHIIIFILIWGFLLKYIPMPIIYKILFLILVCSIYHLFSWPSISYYRAIYLFFLYQIAKLLNQQTNFLHMFFLICVTILLFNPIQLFFLDFQLSFALTFSLAWLSFSIQKDPN